MDSVGTRVTCHIGYLYGLDDPDNFRIFRVGLGVENVDARRAQARHDQIPALDVGMRHIP